MKQLLIAVSVMAILIFSGCSRKVDVINMEVYNDTKKFDGVTIQCLDDNESKQLQNLLERTFKSKRIPLNGGLVVRCGYGIYDRGNRFLRSTIGFGAGHARAAANFILQSKTGEKIAKFDVNIILNRGPFLGGNADWMHKAAVKEAYAEIQKYIEKNSLTREEIKANAQAAAPSQSNTPPQAMDSKPDTAKAKTK